MSKLSKTEESKLDKLKHFLGIGGGRGSYGQITSGNQRPMQREFIFTDELLKEISKETPLPYRLKNVSDLSEIVFANRLEPNAVEAIWLVLRDMLSERASVDERNTVLHFLKCLIQGQFEQLGPMKVYFFNVLKGHTLFEDLSPRLDVLVALTKNGKDLEYIEDEIGAFLLEFIKPVMSSDRIVDYLKLLINVLKFNAAYIDEDIVGGFVMNTCSIATKTSKNEEVEVSMDLMDTVICYSYMPLSALNHFVVCLCQILNIERFAGSSWQLMRKLLGTHVGHNAVHSMCTLLQESSSATGSSALMLRGAVFFISMALWGNKRVTTLKYPPNAVLPAFLLSLSQCSASLLANEIILSIQRLITRYAGEQPIVTWDLILEVLEKLVQMIENDPKPDSVMVKNLHDLLTLIESMHEKKEFLGSTDRFFSIIEMCAKTRPESSILLLISHRVQFIYPSSKDNWISKLNHLLEKYFTNENRAKIRLKLIDIVEHIIIKHKYLYEEDLIKLVVIPNFSKIDEISNNEVKTKAIILILGLVESSQSNLVTNLLDIIQKVVTRPALVNSIPRSPPVGQTDPANKEWPLLSTDEIMPAIVGLTKLFKTKLFEIPTDVCVRIYDMLVNHLFSHYNSKFLLTYSGNVRMKIFDVLLNLRADTEDRLGLFNNHKNGVIIYSSFVAISRRGGNIEPTHTEYVMSYAKLFKCIRIALEKELDWSVLKLILDHLPLVLQNKTLLMSADWTDVDQFCGRLQAMVREHTPSMQYINVPPRLTKSDFHSCLFPVLTCLVAYHDMVDKQKQRELVKCLEFGLVSKCARICVRALTVCALEMVDIMMRMLPSVLLKLSQISATVAMAIPLMEFLSSLIHCPYLYRNFVEDQYMSIFAIALPYTNPFKYNHYTVSLAYNVIGLWFVKCRIPFRKGFVGFILKGLKSNVLRQFEETSQRSLNQDSSDRFRSQSLNEEAQRSEENSKESRSKVAAAQAKAKTSQPAITLASLDEGMSVFHKELTETCVDMLTRFTYSTRSSLPKRSPVAEFLLKGGQSQSWLLGNRIITITTSGGSEVGRAGLCERCLIAARLASSRFSKQPSTSMDSDMGSVRRRHRSAAVRTMTESVSLKPLSHDDISLNNRNSALESDIEVRGERSNSIVLPVSDAMVSSGISNEQVPLDTKQEKIQAVDAVLMSLRAKPSDRSIFSPLLCNCWCTEWAEIHVRRSTGSFSWIMRIQNETDILNTFPDFPLADVSSLFMQDKSQHNTEPFKGERIDGYTIPEKDYENLWEEHFHGKPEAQPVTLEADPNDSTIQRNQSAPELVSESNPISEAEKKAMIADLTVQPVAVPVKQGSPLPKLDVKGAKAMEKLDKPSEPDPRSPNTKLDSPKRDARSIRVSSSNSSFVCIPEDSESLDTSMDSSSRSSLYSTLFGREGSIQGGMNPSFLFLQLYHTNSFGSTDDRPLQLPNTESIQRSLKMIDLIYPFQTHRIAVIYVGEGQTNNEAAILSNQYGSERYMRFLEGLGQIRHLRDCNPETTYLGGLQTSGADGDFVYVWHDEIIQVVYHVPTLMPTRESDRACTMKKMHIGNDYVTIVYNDSKEDYKIGTIKGQFNYVNIIITPLDKNSNAVTVQTRDDIEEMIGHTDTKIISDEHMSSLIRQMALHADVASIILQKQKKDPKDPFASNWLERLRHIKRLRAKVVQENASKSPNQANTSKDAHHSVDDFTDFIS